MTRKDGRRLIAAALIWSCIVVLLASLPYIAGIALRAPGQTFAGFTFNIDDSCVYASWIRQVVDGNFLLRNQFTTDPQPVLQFNLFFLVLGLIARVAHLSPAAVLHLARVVLGVCPLMLVWKFSARFMKDPRERLLVVPVVGLSAGLGWVVPGILAHKGPVDLWQPEAITFLSIYLNPLFLIGLILMVASFHFLLKMKDTGSWKDAALAGLMLLILGNVHTYDVLTVGAVWCAYLVFESMRTRRLQSASIGRSIVAALIVLPAIGYQFYLYYHVRAFQARVESAAPAPAFWTYLMGYGLLIVLAALGGWLAVKEKREAFLLIIWAIVGFALPYVPVAQQRKLVMGLHLPIALLSVVAIAAAAKKIGPRASAVFVIPLVAALFLSNLVFMNRDVGYLLSGTTGPDYNPYLSASDLDAMNWLRRNTGPTDTVLTFPSFKLYVVREHAGTNSCPPGSALFVPVVAGNQVYYGHWSETPDYGRKLNEWVKFIYAGTPDEWRRAYLSETGAKYIIYFRNPGGAKLVMDSDKLLPLTDLRRADYLKLVYESGNTALYEVL